MINEADVAGEISVELEFWETEDLETSYGTTARSVSIGGQERREISIYANPTSSDVEYTTMSVSRQSCQ